MSLPRPCVALLGGHTAAVSLHFELGAVVERSVTRSRRAVPGPRRLRELGNRSPLVPMLRESGLVPGRGNRSDRNRSRCSAGITAAVALLADGQSFPELAQGLADGPKGLMMADASSRFRCPGSVTRSELARGSAGIERPGCGRARPGARASLRPWARRAVPGARLGDAVEGIEHARDGVAVALVGAVAITAAVVLADECLSRSFALAGQRSRLLGCLRRWH